MTFLQNRFSRTIAEFCKDDAGVVSVEFVLIFPTFFALFLMTIESGLISLNQVMLDRGVDLAVRDVRLGTIAAASDDADDLETFQDRIKERICQDAFTILNCAGQLQIEMVSRDLRAWTDIPGEVTCVDRSLADQPVSGIVSTANNQLVFLKVCVRIDPWLIASGLGREIVAKNTDDASGHSYALVSRAAFVVEPFVSTGSGT